jgi:nitroreductase
MELDECLNCGHCKNYLDTPIPKDVIDKILHAATHAYSPADLQNWEFVVVENAKTKQDIAKAAKNQNWINQAPVLIMVCNNHKRVKHLFPEKGDIYSDQAVAAASQIILLKAEELGLGSCWIAGFDEKVVGRILNLPSGTTARIIITLGYAEFKPKKSDPESVAQLTHYNEYGNTSTVSHFNLTNTSKKIEDGLKKKAKKIFK